MLAGGSLAGGLFFFGAALFQASLPFMPGAARWFLMGFGALLGIVGLVAAFYLILAMRTNYIHWKARKELAFAKEFGHYAHQRPVIALPQQAASLQTTEPTVAFSFEDPRPIIDANLDPNDVLGKEERVLIGQRVPLPVSEVKKQSQRLQPIQKPVAKNFLDDELSPESIDLNPKKQIAKPVAEQDDDRPFAQPQVKTVESKEAPEDLAGEGTAQPSMIEEEEEKVPDLDFSPPPKKIILPPPVVIPEKKEVVPVQKPSSIYVPKPGVFVEKKLPGKIDLKQILDDGFWPTKDAILLGLSAEGLVTIPINQLWHILFGGPTGAGKSILRRLIMAQLMCLGAKCYMSDIHYYPKDRDNNIRWDIIEERLENPVLRHAEPTAAFFKWVSQELQERIDRLANDEEIGEPMFIFVEEYPGLLDRLEEIDKNTVKMVKAAVKKILREGRKYKICYCGAAQGALVDTLNMDSALRKNIRTCFYGGEGDEFSKAVLMNLQKGQTLDDTPTKEPGVLYARTNLHKPTLIRVPWASDESVERLLAKSPLPIRTEQAE